MAVKELTEFHIDLSNLASGVYFLELLNGGQLTIKRIAKE
ncbi:MAG: T9SS type A sorting domain-containing protein [Saprospiraceae bacterium]|nr:T9SS type A sorting domain-containing protein [Saprospiraceae bacterium]